MRIADGDSITVERTVNGGKTQKVKIRLYGIDTPEYASNGWGEQPYSREAQDFLATLLRSGRVAIVDMGYDRYSRTVGSVISLPDGKVVQEELLKAGLAWVYTKYCRGCTQWKALEEEARQERRGIWGSVDSVPPWEWRKHKRQ